MGLEVHSTFSLTKCLARERIKIFQFLRKIILEATQIQLYLVYPQPAQVGFYYLHFTDAETEAQKSPLASLG